MRLFRPIAAGLICALGAGCLGDATYQPPTAYRARVQPVGGSEVIGTVDAISQGRSQTQAGLNAQGDPGTKYGWQINHGTCAEPGAILGGPGNYPDFTTAPVTADSALVGKGRVDQTFVSALMERETPYHAVIVDPANRTRIVACGNFNRLSF